MEVLLGTCQKHPGKNRHTDGTPARGFPMVRRASILSDDQVLAEYRGSPDADARHLLSQALSLVVAIAVTVAVPPHHPIPESRIKTTARLIPHLGNIKPALEGVVVRLRTRCALGCVDC